jgi:hypothetical protein
MFTKLYDALGVIVGEESVRVFMTGLIGCMHSPNVGEGKKGKLLQEFGELTADSLRGFNSQIGKLAVTCCSSKIHKHIKRNTFEAKLYHKLT